MVYCFLILVACILISSSNWKQNCSYSKKLFHFYTSEGMLTCQVQLAVLLHCTNYKLLTLDLSLLLGFHQIIYSPTQPPWTSYKRQRASTYRISQMWTYQTILKFQCIPLPNQRMEFTTYTIMEINQGIILYISPSDVCACTHCKGLYSTNTSQSIPNCFTSLFPPHFERKNTSVAVKDFQHFLPEVTFSLFSKGFHFSFLSVYFSLSIIICVLRVAWGHDVEFMGGCQVVCVLCWGPGVFQNH